jgi:hypothetical protein
MECKYTLFVANLNKKYANKIRELSISLYLGQISCQ